MNQGKENKSKFPIVGTTVKLTGVLATLFWISRLSFSQKQVEAIWERDNGKCQYPGCTNKTKYKVEVHHVTPQGYSIRINNMRPDSPFNAVCLCEEHHVGYPKKDREKSGLGRRAVYREQEKGMVWDPIHPDTYLVHLVLVGKINQIPQRLREKLDAEFPGLVEYYEEVFSNKQGGEVDLNDMYTVVMRKWRSDKLDMNQIYWNSSHDSALHIAAITNTISAIKKGWKFPLRQLGGNVKQINKGMYAWDNMAALAIQRYITSMRDHQFNKLMATIEKAGANSRIEYYNSIYVPATRMFDNTGNMGGMINHYLNQIGEKKANRLIKNFDSAKDNPQKAWSILYNEFYNPAIKLHRSHGGRRERRYAKTGRRSRYKEQKEKAGLITFEAPTGIRGGLHS